MAYVTVDEIVNNVLNDQGRVTTHGYLRLLHIANRGLKELTFDVLGATKIQLITIDSELKIDLPGDFVDYEFIGIVNNDYSLEPLGINNKIPAVGNVNKDFKSGDQYATPIGTWFGVGGGQNGNGYYIPTIDYDNWQMILGSMYAGQTIYLEYITDGKQEGGQNIVHPYAEEALISWVHWKSISKMRSYSANDKEMARRDYFLDKAKAVSRIQSFTKEELMQQLRRGFKQAPKI